MKSHYPNAEWFRKACVRVQASVEPLKENEINQEAARESIRRAIIKCAGWKKLATIKARDVSGV